MGFLERITLTVQTVFLVLYFTGLVEWGWFVVCSPLIVYTTIMAFWIGTILLGLLIGVHAIAESEKLDRKRRI